MNQNTKYQGELLEKSQKFQLAPLIHLGLMFVDDYEIFFNVKWYSL